MNERTNEAASSATGKGQTGILLAVVMLAFMGQMMLNPILAPLARMIGLEEWHVGAIISMAALVLTLLSQFWGRRSQKVGPKRVLIFAMLLGFLALGSFALVAYAGSRGLIAGFWLVFGAVATRGILYGSAISAVLPAAQSARSGDPRVHFSRTRSDQSAPFGEKLGQNALFREDDTPGMRFSVRVTLPDCGFP